MKEKSPDTSTKPKVLYVITKSNFGGAQRYVFELAKRSKEEGFETAVALGGDGILIKKLEEIGIQTFRLNNAQRDIHITKEIKLLYTLFTVIRKFKPTVLHLNSPKIGGLGAVAGRLLNVPQIIYTNHGWPFKEDRPEWQLMLIRFFSWLTIFCNKKIIVLSETEREYVSNWPLANKKIHVIPNGLSPFTILQKKDAQAKLFSNFEVDKDTIVVGTISELHKNKGLGYAIEGIQQYISHAPKKKIVFVIIGEGERRNELQSKITALHMDKNILLAGHVDDARSYLSAFDFFLLSSVKEGLPYAILEAGAAGIPVISTSVGGIPEVIKNFETGLLIPPRRPQEIKNALIYTEEHPEVVAKISTGLQEKIQKDFNFDTIYKKTLDTYLR